MWKGLEGSGGQMIVLIRLKVTAGHGAKAFPCAFFLKLENSYNNKSAKNIETSRNRQCIERIRYV
jgi:hypothetical protein